MYVNKCIKCGEEFETKNPKRVICPNCLYSDKKYTEGLSQEAANASASSSQDEPREIHILSERIIKNIVREIMNATIEDNTTELQDTVMIAIQMIDAAVEITDINEIIVITEIVTIAAKAETTKDLTTITDLETMTGSNVPEIILAVQDQTVFQDLVLTADVQDLHVNKNNYW